MIKFGIIIGITLGFSILDVITGYISAIYKKKVSSSVMRKGLLKKALLVLVIATAALLQYAQSWINLGLEIPVLTVTCAFIIWMETTSIFENADKILDGRLSNLIIKIIKKEDK